MSKRRTFPVLVLAVLGLISSAVAELKLPAVISDNMVLQQESRAPLWGWAEKGQTVSVSASWTERVREVKVDEDGKWRARVRTPKAGGPYTIKVSCGAESITIKDVLIGEVWVCSGQSNMEFRVSGVNNAAEEIAAANYPQIRMFTVVKKVADEPQSDCQGSWQAASPETVEGFSAVGYFFGRYLHKELNVPVGLLHTSWGGTPAEAWTKMEVLEGDEDFKPIVDRYESVVANWEKIKGEYAAKVEEWKKAAAEAKKEGKRAPGYPGQPYGPGHPHQPAGLYNAMLAPLMPYRIQGAIWYQGESNAGRSYQYRTLFPAMIENWRADWKQGDFPFYFVQIAPYSGQTPEIREAQLIALRNTKNTGMAVTMDIGNPDDIHPKNKQDVGKRLALWALANTYGKKDIVYSGPLYKSMKVEGDKIRIAFDHVGGGLAAKGGELTHFIIAEEGKDFVAAKAVIDGDTIVVSADGVGKPAAVRYGWENGAEPNLFNKEGLPASPFRTDDRRGETFGRY
jgi:sialate O-acetylesterase